MQIFTEQEEIEKSFFGRPHCLLLGAGASLAAFPLGDKYGKKLPVMNNFIETLDIESFFQKAGFQFFRNAKQLSDMEGATIRSKQGVTIALCLVSWIDSLLHFENFKRSTSGKLSKEPLTVPSIVRRAQYENLTAFIDKVQNEDDFIRKWLEIEKKSIERKRKKHYQLVELNEPNAA